MYKLDNIKSPAVKTCVTIMLTTALFGAAFVLMYFRSDSITQVEVSSVQNVQASRELTVDAISREIASDAANVQSEADTSIQPTGAQAGDGTSIYSRVPTRPDFTDEQIKERIADGTISKDLFYQISYIVKHEIDPSNVQRYETCYVQANAAWNHFNKANALSNPIDYCKSNPGQMGNAYTIDGVSEDILFSNHERNLAVAEIIMLGESGDIIRGCAYWFGRVSGHNLYTDGNKSISCWYAIGSDAVKLLNVFHQGGGVLHNKNGSPVGITFYNGSTNTWNIKDGDFYEQ